VDFSPLSGIDAASMSFDQVGAAIASMSASPDVDLSSQLVKLDLAGTQIDVSARILQAQDATTQSLLDIVA
jgi:hypothetical protein